MLVMCPSPYPSLSLCILPTISTAQVLTSGQQDQTFRVTEDMLFSNVDFDLSMRGLTCAEVQFVCVEFAKGDSPDTVFNLIPVPDDSVMVSCSPAECEGIFNSCLKSMIAKDYLSASNQVVQFL